MPTAGKFCTPSSPRERHGFSPFYMVIEPPLNMILSPSSTKYELDRTIIQPIKQVAPRSSIRGFKDDYYHVDSDVVILSGETHIWRKPVRIAPHFLSRTWVNTNSDLISPFC
jgi:hypothetical protein